MYKSALCAANKGRLRLREANNEWPEIDNDGKASISSISSKSRLFLEPLKSIEADSPGADGAVEDAVSSYLPAEATSDPEMVEV